MGSPMLKSAIGRFRVVAALEGTSFLVLLGIAMPLKYLAGEPTPVRIVGLVHGMLFMLYGFMLADAVTSKRWSKTQAARAFVASLLPFGTFVLDPGWRREQEAEAAG